MTAIATAIGPVGPDICERVPPNTAAKKPTAIAPYMPASAPKPRCHAEGQRDGQSDHRCGDAAKDIAAEGVKVVCKPRKH